MPVAREQLSTTFFDYGECSESVVFQLENPVGIVEGSGPFQERHGLELIEHRATRIAKIDGELS